MMRNLDNDKDYKVLRLRATNSVADITRDRYDVSRNRKILAYVETISKVNGSRDPDVVSARLVVIELRSRKEIYSTKIDTYMPRSVSISPDGSLIAMVTAKSTVELKQLRVMVIRLSDGKVLLEDVKSSAFVPSWSPDSRSLSITDEFGIPVILDVIDGQRTQLPGAGIPYWSPDGAHIAIDNQIYNVKMKSRKILNLRDGYIVSGLSPDSDYLLLKKENFLMEYDLYAYKLNSGIIIPMNIRDSGLTTRPSLWR